MTWANWVTLARLALIPFVLLTLAWEQRGGSFLLLLLFLAGDVLDGYLARSRGEITALGQFLDPLADKLLAFGLLSWFAVVGAVSEWAVFLLVLQNAALLAGSIALWRRHQATLPARAGGKASAGALSLGLVLLYLGLAQGAWLVYLGVGLAYWAAVDYGRLALRTR